MARREHGNARAQYDQLLHSNKPDVIVGLDEVGVGCIAGPVYVGAVVVTPGFDPYWLRDSKQTDESEREQWHEQLKLLVTDVGSYSVRFRSAECIDSCGIKGALDKAFDDAVNDIFTRIDSYKRVLLITDGLDMYVVPSTHRGISIAIPKADTAIPAVMAAANLAKVYRDRYMCSLAADDPKYALYGFDKSKGYGTDAHLVALKKHGIMPEHRRSYKTIKQICGEGRR